MKEIKDQQLNSLIEKKRVVIVGPSPHLVNKNLGDFIDNFDTVIRINELGVISKMFPDYGSRTDVSFLSLTDESVPMFIKMKDEIDLDPLKLIVHPRDEFNLNPYRNVEKTKNVIEYFQYLGLNKNFYHIDNPSFEKRCQIFNCFPSTGSLSIIELLKYDFEELYICGFSFYTTKYRYSPKGMEYFRIPIKNQHKHNLRQSGHDMRQEIKILKKILKKYPNVIGDKLFTRIVLSSNNFYYETRRFIIYKINLDNFKNIIKKIFRKKTYRKLKEKYW
jgi:hypothetical protein